MHRVPHQPRASGTLSLSPSLSLSLSLSLSHTHTHTLSLSVEADILDSHHPASHSAQKSSKKQTHTDALESTAAASELRFPPQPHAFLIVFSIPPQVSLLRSTPPVPSSKYETLTGASRSLPSNTSEQAHNR